MRRLFSLARLGCVGAFVICTALAAAQQPRVAEVTSAGAPPPSSSERFGAVPDFRFTRADGAVVTRADLVGAPWLAVPFFVRCSGP